MSGRRAPLRVAIAGGGASSVLVLLHLLRFAGPRRLEIHVLERSGVFGRGIAYAKQPHCCLLNVPAAQLGLFDDEPQGFVSWLQASGQVAAPAGFAPRAVFGDFLEDALARSIATAPAGHTVRLLPSEAIRVETQPGGTLRITSADADTLTVDALVLATGNERPRPALPLAPGAGMRTVDNPWLPDALADIAADARVLILGTGLTAVDAILLLQDRGFGGTLVACSRHGLLPHVHAARPGAFLLGDAIKRPLGLADLVHELRAEVHRAQGQGLDWRHVLGALRPHTAALWAALSQRDRTRFLHHLRPYWDVHRHRMAPAVAEQLDALRAAGRLEIRATRGRALATDERFDWVIHCTTPNNDAGSTANPLLRSALRQGLLHPDPVGLGFRTADPRIPVHPMGVLRLGELWECTAFPELRAQARDAAFSILHQAQANTKSKPLIEAIPLTAA